MMYWAVVRESWRKGLAVVVAVGLSSLMLRGLATQSVYGDWASDEAAQAVQLMALLGVMPLLAVALAGARPLDASVAWVLTRPIPRWSLAALRMATDASILAACLLVSLAVLGVPDRVAAVEAVGLLVDVTSPWVVLLVALMAHGCTAAFVAMGVRPLAAAALGFAWVAGMVALPLVVRTAGLEWLSYRYVHMRSDPEYVVLAAAWLGTGVIALLSCLGIAWRMVLAGARHAPLAAPRGLLVRQSLYVQALCVVIHVAAFAYADASIDRVFRKGEAGIRARFQDDQGRPIVAWQPRLVTAPETPFPFRSLASLASARARRAVPPIWGVLTEGEVVDIAAGTYFLCTQAIPAEALLDTQRLACWEQADTRDECAVVEVVEGYSTVVVPLQTPPPWQPDCPWLTDERPATSR